MKNHHTSENYGSSIGDLMAALLFLFILLLMSFILSFNTKKDALSRPIIEREKLLVRLKKDIEQQVSIKVEIDVKNGILRLRDQDDDPRKMFFRSSEYNLTPYGINVLEKIRTVFMGILPCYAHKESFSRFCILDKRDKFGLIDTVLIEGHSDTDKIGGKLSKKYNIENNLDLSSKRALKTFQFLLGYDEKKGQGNRLFNLHNGKIAGKSEKFQKIFGVSGYGQFRRLSSEKTKHTQLAKRRDRRIDIRFIMAMPKDVKVTQQKGIINI